MTGRPDCFVVQVRRTHTDVMRLLNEKTNSLFNRLNKRCSFDLPNHAHFITFSCHRNRHLLGIDTAKRIFLHRLDREINRHEAGCAGFVVMPDHVHFIVQFPETGYLVTFIKNLKRLSSFHIKQFLYGRMPEKSTSFDKASPVWQRRYHDFNITTYGKLIEKLIYMHENPVRAGLVERADDWPFSSARWYLHGRPVGVTISAP